MSEMSPTSPGARIASWGAGLTSLSLAVLAIILPSLLGDGAVGDPSELGLHAWVIASSVLGLVLVLRTQATRIGALMLVIGLGGAMAAVGDAIPIDPDHMSWLVVVPIGSLGWLLFLALTIAGLPLLFPTGAPPTPRWRPVLWTLMAVLGFAALMSTFSSELSVFCSDVYPDEVDCSVWQTSDEVLAIGACDPVVGPRGSGTECVVTLDNPIGLSWVPELEDSTLGNIGFVGLLLTSILAVVSLGMRMRRAGSLERQQIKMVFFVLGALIVFTLVEAVAEEVLDRPVPGSGVFELVAWVAIPVSIFLAITRYRLYEIDRLISRTVAYAIVVTVLAGLVGLAATLIGTRFTEPLVVAAATLFVAAAFNPLRRRVQAVVDRRFNRSRYDAQRVMDEFVGSLRDRVDADQVIEGWLGVVGSTMQPAAAGVWVKS